MATSQTDPASASFIKALVPMVAWAINRKGIDYAYKIENSDTCWYPQACSALSKIVPRLTGSDVEYSKDKAMADAESAVATSYDKLKREVLPAIYTKQCIVSGYNSTSIKLLADAGLSEAMKAAIGISLEYIKAYATIRQGDHNTVYNLLGATKGSFGTGNVSQSAANDNINQFVRMAELVTHIFDNNKVGNDQSKIGTPDQLSK